ncbi:MAG: hypothetical protein ACTSPT_03815 [Candidatus Heimdallarchaeota archaeon]
MKRNSTSTETEQDILSTMGYKKTIKEKIISFLTRPETIVVFVLILARVFFVLFFQWGFDFDFYVEIAENIFAGQQLYVDFQSTHMPLVDYLYAAMYALNIWQDSIIAIRIFMKLPFLLCDIGIAFAIMKIIEVEYLKRNELENNELIEIEHIKKIYKLKLVCGLFIALGLPLVFQTGGGRYDSLMILCFTLVIFSLQKEKWFLVGFFAALATSTKYIGIIFLPFVFFWMKKEHYLAFFSGLLIGLIPIYPFLILIPKEFISAIFLRSSHIAYGFSPWHAIFIIWNGFSLKHLNGIDATYDSGGEPWFVSDLYLPLFIVIYLVVFILYLIRWWPKMRTEPISDQPLSLLLSTVFTPLFIFALTFKAINIQYLAWFIPFFALKRKLGITIEYSILTVVHGLAIMLFEASNPEVFEKLFIQASASQGTVMYKLVVGPILWVIEHTPVALSVSIIMATIVWYLIRTSIIFGKSLFPLLSKDEPE